MNLSIITYKGSNNIIHNQKYLPKNYIFKIIFRNFAV